MRKNWNWMHVGARLGVANLAVCTSLLSAPVLFASDDPPEVKTESNVQVVVTSSDSGDLLEQVRKALEDSKVAPEKRTKIMEQLKSTVEKTKLFKVQEAGDVTELPKRVLEITQSALATADAKGTEQSEGNVLEINVDQDGKQTTRFLRLNNGQVSGRLISPLAKQGEVYRIGVALVQLPSEGDEGSDEPKESKDESVKVLKGVVVESTMSESPAEKVGIKKGDIIISANKKEITAHTDLMEMIQESGKNEKPLELTVRRDGETMTVEVKPTKMKPSDIAMETIELALPKAEGFLLNSKELAERFKDVESMRNAQMDPAVFLQALRVAEPSGLSKEVAELKEEIAELKKLVKELVEKK